MNASDCVPDADWVSFGGRSIPAPHPGPDLAPAARDYDDSDWPVVNAPHDFLISGTYNEANGEQFGFLPRNISWCAEYTASPKRLTGFVWERSKRRDL